MHPQQHGVNPLLSKPTGHFEIQPSELRRHPRNTNMSKHWLFLFSNKTDQTHGRDLPWETHESNPTNCPSHTQLFLGLLLPAGTEIAMLLHRLHVSSFWYSLWSHNPCPSSSPHLCKKLTETLGFPQKHSGNEVPASTAGFSTLLRCMPGLLQL